jgi:N6-L-threonylcarbamoyladenine synthase
MVIPSLRYCTDNAAMIGWVAAQRLARGERHPLSLNAVAVADLGAPRAG